MMDEILRSTEPSAEPQFLQRAGGTLALAQRGQETGQESNACCWRDAGDAWMGSSDTFPGVLGAEMSYPVRGRQSLSQTGRKIGLLASTLIRAQMKIKRLEIQCTVWNCVFLGRI